MTQKKISMAVALLTAVGVLITFLIYINSDNGNNSDQNTKNGNNLNQTINGSGNNIGELNGDFNVSQ